MGICWQAERGFKVEAYFHTSRTTSPIPLLKNVMGLNIDALLIAK